MSQEVPHVAQFRGPEFVTAPLSILWRFGEYTAQGKIGFWLAQGRTVDQISVDDGQTWTTLREPIIGTSGRVEYAFEWSV